MQLMVPKIFIYLYIICLKEKRRNERNKSWWARETSLSLKELVAGPAPEAVDTVVAHALHVAVVDPNLRIAGSVLQPLAPNKLRRIPRDPAPAYD
jgi:hypothetical protein